MPIYLTKILAISLQKRYQNFTKNFLVKHHVKAIKWGVARKTLSLTQLCSASEFILFIYIGLRWAQSNKIRAHIGVTFVFQGETDFVKCRAQVCLSAQELHRFFFISLKCIFRIIDRSRGIFWSGCISEFKSRNQICSVIFLQVVHMAFVLANGDEVVLHRWVMFLEDGNGSSDAHPWVEYIVFCVVCAK